MAKVIENDLKEKKTELLIENLIILYIVFLFIYVFFRLNSIFPVYFTSLKMIFLVMYLCDGAIYTIKFETLIHIVHVLHFVTSLKINFVQLDHAFFHVLIVNGKLCVRFSRVCIRCFFLIKDVSDKADNLPNIYTDFFGRAYPRRKRVASLELKWEIA
ncbi:hypothetical protein L9F63_015010, partial [Diploptera punctata]